MRFIKEFFNPKLKCERIGHKLITEKIEIRKESNDYRVIARDYAATRERCKRCDYTEEPIIVKELNYFTSVTMPREMWNEMREKGYLYLRTTGVIE